METVGDDEKKFWEDKRRDQDKLSSEMGEYLLKGYRMLDSYCDKCGNILMGSPQASSRNNIFCLRCLHTEEPINDTTVVESSPAVSTTNVAGVVSTASVASGGRCSASLSIEEGEALQSARKGLVHKLIWATQELEKSSSVESCTQLTLFIQSACSALKQLKDVE